MATVLSRLDTVSTLLDHPNNGPSKNKGSFRFFIVLSEGLLSQQLNQVAPSSFNAPIAREEARFEEPNALSTWVTLGIEVIAQKLFSSRPIFFHELNTKSAKSLQRKAQNKEFSYLRFFEGFWEAHRQCFLTDLIGTFILGVNVGTTLLSKLYQAKQKGEPQEVLEFLYLRLRTSSKALEIFHRLDPETSQWTQSFRQKGLEILSIFGEEASLSVNETICTGHRESLVQIHDFVIFYLSSAEYASLDGRSLTDLFSFQNRTQAFDYHVSASLQMNRSIPSDPEINVFHILSGTIQASLQQTAEVDHYFSIMLETLEKRSHAMIPVLNVPTPKVFPPPLFEFLHRYGKTEEVKRLAQSALKNPGEAPKLAKQITYLDLKGLQLETLPEEFYLFSNLHTLDLSTNSFESVPPPLLKLNHLKVLRLNGNRLTSLPSGLATLPSLNRLDILENPIPIVPLAFKGVIAQLPYLASWESP